MSFLSRLAGGLAKAVYKRKILPVLFEYMENSCPVDFNPHTETILLLLTLPDEREVFK